MFVTFKKILLCHGFTVSRLKQKYFSGQIGRVHQECNQAVVEEVAGRHDPLPDLQLLLLLRAQRHRQGHEDIPPEDLHQVYCRD